MIWAWECRHELSERSRSTNEPTVRAVAELVAAPRPPEEARAVARESSTTMTELDPTFLATNDKPPEAKVLSKVVVADKAAAVRCHPAAEAEIEVRVDLAVPKAVVLVRLGAARKPFMSANASKTS